MKKTSEIYTNVSDLAQREAWDVALKKGTADDGDKFVYRVDPSQFEAAIAEPKDGTKILYIGIPRPGKPPICWHKVARFDYRQIGRETSVEYRPVRTEVSAAMLRALELLHGRDDFQYMTGPLPTMPKKVKLDGAVMIEQASGSRVLMVKHHVWFPVETYRRAQTIARNLTRAEKGFNYPEFSHI